MNTLTALVTKHARTEAAVESIEAEVRDMIRQLEITTVLRARDDDLSYCVEHDEDDSGRRQRIYASSCDCSWSRVSQTVTPCRVHAEVASDLRDLERTR